MKAKLARAFVALIAIALLAGCSKSEEPAAAGPQPTAAEASQAGVGGDSSTKPTTPAFDPSK